MAPPASTQHPLTPPASTQHPPTPPASTQRPPTPPASTQRPPTPPASTQRPPTPPASTQRPPTPPASTQCPPTPPASTQRPPTPPTSTQRPPTPPASTQHPPTPPASTQHPLTPPASTQRPPTPPASTQRPLTPPAPNSTPPDPALIAHVLLFVAACIFITFQVSIALHLSPDLHVHTSSSQQVIELYQSELCDKYIKTLTNLSKTGRASNPVPFISLISIVVTNFTRSTAHWLLSAPPIDVKQNQKVMQIQIEDILKPVSEEQLKFVLIEGEPGMGKSTLAKELALRWANGSDTIMNKYDIVFLIQLRFETYHKAISIEDLFVDLDNQSINMTDLHVEIKKRKGAGILWILDDFDELPRYSKSNSVIMKLIEGDILPKSTVIVISKPDPSNNYLLKHLHENDSKRISLRGFDSTKIEEYASKYFNDEDKASEFRSYYSGNLVIESMLHNPLHCFIVCTIFNESIATSNDQYPKTMTSLYNQYIRILLKRHLNGTGLNKMPQRLMLETDFNDSFALQSIWKDFSLLSKIASNGVKKQKYIFGKELYDVNKLGMMDTVANFFALKKDESSSFLHTTLQEYLAAVYLVNDNNLNIEIKKNPNLLMFYVGICNITGKEMNSEVINILKQSMTTLFNEYIYIDSVLLGCLYEDDSLLYNIGLPSNHSLYTYKSILSTSFDYYILGYLIAVHNITYNTVFSTSDQIKAFNNGLQSQLSHSSIKGKLKLFFAGYLSKENGQIKELLQLPRSVVIELIIDISSSDISEFCQIITKFYDLQTVQLYASSLQWSCNEAPENPLLGLKKLNKLHIIIKYRWYENDLITLKQLTAPGRPLKILQVVNYGLSYYNKIFDLIKMPTSLEEVTITDGIELQHIVWIKSTNNLRVDDYKAFFYQTTLPTIRLSSFTSFTYIKSRKTRSMDMWGKHIQVNVTVYSETTFRLNQDFIDAFDKCIMLFNQLPVKDRTNKVLNFALNRNFMCTCASTLAEQDKEGTSPNKEFISAKEFIYRIFFFSIIIILVQCQSLMAHAHPFIIYIVDIIHSSVHYINNYIYLVVIDIIHHVDLSVCLDILLICFVLLIAIKFIFALIFKNLFSSMFSL